MPLATFTKQRPVPRHLAEERAPVLYTEDVAAVASCLGLKIYELSLEWSHPYFGGLYWTAPVFYFPTGSDAKSYARLLRRGGFDGWYTDAQFCITSFPAHWRHRDGRTLFAFDDSLDGIVSKCVYADIYKEHAPAVSPRRLLSKILGAKTTPLGLIADDVLLQPSDAWLFYDFFGISSGAAHSNPGLCAARILSRNPWVKPSFFIRKEELTPALALAQKLRALWRKPLHVTPKHDGVLVSVRTDDSASNLNFVEYSQDYFSKGHNAGALVFDVVRQGPKWATYRVRYFAKIFGSATRRAK